ncbi:MAG: sortase [Chloroflexi bacterium]|nr:sortase [Chloroflexota bacterium]
MPCPAGEGPGQRVGAAVWGFAVVALSVTLGVACTLAPMAVPPQEVAPPSVPAVPAATAVLLAPSPGAPTVPMTSALPSPTTTPTATPAASVPPAPTGVPSATAPEPTQQQAGASIETRPLVAAPPSPSEYRLLIHAIGVDAPIVAVGLDADGAMAAPDGPDVVGWFAAGPRPGSVGNVLMDGHVDWADRSAGTARRAVFWRLRELTPGEELAVVAGESRFIYRVRASLRFAWDDPEAVQVLAPSHEALLTLITCGGTFDPASRDYSHRRVIVAEFARTE